MHELLAQDFIKIPAPPETTDPLTWIALALVCLLVVLVGWAMTVGFPRMVAAFREEMRAEREKCAEELKSRDEREERRDTRIHQRFDCVAEDLSVIRTKVGG
jgi:hypothetical protein